MKSKNGNWTILGTYLLYTRTSETKVGTRRYCIMIQYRRVLSLCVLLNNLNPLADIQQLNM